MIGGARSTTAATRTGTAGQRGFALITVMFFVIALTILGLSLFSLSNFEAGFFRPAVHRMESVQAARGAVDWARWVVESTDQLDKVRDSAKPPMVQGALARYGADFESGDTTGMVFQDHAPPYEPVWVRVVAGTDGQDRAILAKFQPYDGADLYRRLITAMDYVKINKLDADGSTNRIDQLRLHGRVATPEFHDEHDAPLPASIIPGYTSQDWCPAPVPAWRPEQDVNLNSGWWQAHWTGAVEERANGTSVAFSSAGQPFAVFKAMNDGTEQSGRRWSVSNQDLQTITVTGTCMWMLSEGLRTTKQLHILSGNGAPATLILVARPDPVNCGCLENDVGWAFLGGLNVAPNVRLFVISSGGVELEQVEDAASNPAYAPYLSVYADWVRIQAPVTNGTNAVAQYDHGASCSNTPLEDQFNQLVDQLIDQNLLPNSRFARRRLAMIAGSWQEAVVGSTR